MLNETQGEWESCFHKLGLKEGNGQPCWSQSWLRSDLMRVSTRRRLTLAPGWSAPAPAGSGSRFSCLRAQDGEDDSSTAVTSEASRRRKTDEELAAEFWADIGYPTPASRVWERPSSRRVSPQTTCALEASGPSTSPVSHSMGSPAAARHLVRAPATSKSLVRPWIGPLPPPRISPTRTLGDALPLAGLARATAFMQPATSTTPSSGVSPAESARLMGLGPLPTSGTSHPNHSLRMVNLNRWLSHMWNRTDQRGVSSPCVQWRMVEVSLYVLLELGE